MSTISDALSLPSEQPKPKATPLMTLQQATALAHKKNPVMGLPLVQQPLGVQANISAGKQLAKPALKKQVGKLQAISGAATSNPSSPEYKAEDVLQKANNVLETPFSLLGASLLGAERDNQAGKNWWEGYGGATTDNARRLFREGKLGELSRRYSLTSIEANKARAQAGDVGAQQLQKHPTAFAGVAGAEELVNPLAIGAGKLVEGAGVLGRAGLGAAGRGAADVLKARGVTNPDVLNKLRGAGHVGTFDRFAAQRAAAEQVAHAKGLGKTAQAAADKAATASINLANAREFGLGEARTAVEKLFKDKKLSRPQLVELWRRIEHGGSQTFDPATEQKMTEAMGQYRSYMQQLDQAHVASGLPASRLVKGPGGTYTYAPRQGAWLDQGANDMDEEAQRFVDEHKGAGAGGKGYRAGTAGQNIHRSFPTIAQGEANGMKINPEWNPLTSLERKLAQAHSNIRISESLKQLEDLGLIERPSVNSYGKPNPFNPEFVPHAEVGPNSFGAPALREGARYHPAVNKLLEDITTQVPHKQGILQTINRIASRFEVASPFYHPEVNLAPDIAAAKPNVKEFVHGLLHPSESIPEARKIGASVPYSEHDPIGPSLEPFKSLSRGEKVKRVLKAPINAANAFSNKALYGEIFGTPGIQPRLEAATYRGLKGKLGPDKAMQTVRKIVGEPENIPAAARNGWAQYLQFPAYTLSQARYWAKKLAENPQFYMAPQAAANARNESKGYGPQPGDNASLVPSLVLGKDKHGNPVRLPVPGPANRLLSAADLAGNFLSGNMDSTTAADRFTKLLLNIANPGLSAAGRFAYTELTPAGAPTSYRLFDKDTLQGQGAKPTAAMAGDVLSRVAGRYAPARGGSPGAMFGFSPYTTPANDSKVYKEESNLRYGGRKLHFGDFTVTQHGIETLRKLAKKDRAAGKMAMAAKRDAQADAKALKLFQLEQSQLQGGP